MNASKILKEIEDIKLGILNLEIQTAAIKDDGAARGTMVAAEHIKVRTERLEKMVMEELMHE